MFCPNCGTEISDNALFCFSCGSAIDVDLSKRKVSSLKIEEEFQGVFDKNYKSTTSNIEPASNNNIKLLIIIGIGVIIAIVILIIVLVFLLKGNEASENKVEASTNDSVISQIEDTEESINDETKIVEETPDYPATSREPYPGLEYQTVEAAGFQFSYPSYIYLYNPNAVLNDMQGDLLLSSGDGYNIRISGHKTSNFYSDINELLADDNYASFTANTNWDLNENIVINGVEGKHFYQDEHLVGCMEKYLFWQDDYYIEFYFKYEDDRQYNEQHSIAEEIISTLEYTGVDNFYNDSNYFKYNPNYAPTGDISTSNQNSNISIGNNEASTGVSPDVKEFLDSYEAFMDEYIDYMKKIENGTSSTAALTEYYDLLAQYDDYVKKLDELDTSNMTEADYEYYIDVTARVNKKLLNASM